MLLAVVNLATSVTNKQLAPMVRACAHQLRFHVGPAWEAVPAPVVLFNAMGEVPEGADILGVMDDAEQAGQLGYHRETPEGLPYARVFVAPILAHGGSLTKGSVSLSVSMSHEVCEWFIDPDLSLWADGPTGMYPVEVCDPVENDAYEIDGVAVSNFVTRSFFNKNAPSSTQFDYSGKLSAPFTCSQGGYMQVRRGGHLDFISGERRETWVSESKDFPAARSARRRSSVAGLTAS